LEPRILSAGEIQTEVLDPDTLLLHYHLGAEGSYLWAVSRGSVAAFGLPPREEIEDAARRAHELLRISHRRRLRANS
jgi:hypothetical protein